MSKIAVIIPSRLAAQRLPNKPLELINDKEMILHVYNNAVQSNVGEVYVATPDKSIEELIKKNNGKAILTKTSHSTGTDRVFEAVQNSLQNKPEVIINLQGDMPNINPKAISFLSNHMLKGQSQIATLASKMEKKEIKDQNIVKVKTQSKIDDSLFSSAVDFFRLSNENTHENVYHHIGIYAFTYEALLRYVNLKRSNLEIERNLEQMRALQNKINIEVGFTSSSPLSVDTFEDLEKIRSMMRKNKW